MELVAFPSARNERRLPRRRLWRRVYYFAVQLRRAYPLALRSLNHHAHGLRVAWKAYRHRQMYLHLAQTRCVDGINIPGSPAYS